MTDDRVYLADRSAGVLDYAERRSRVPLPIWPLWIVAVGALIGALMGVYRAGQKHGYVSYVQISPNPASMPPEFDVSPLSAAIRAVPAAMKSDSGTANIASEASAATGGRPISAIDVRQSLVVEPILESRLIMIRVIASDPTLDAPINAAALQYAQSVRDDYFSITTASTGAINPPDKRVEAVEGGAVGSFVGVVVAIPLLLIAIRRRSATV